MEECGRTLNVGTMQGEEVMMVHECNTQGQWTVHKKKKSTDRVQWVETSVWLICDRRTADLRFTRRRPAMMYALETVALNKKTGGGAEGGVENFKMSLGVPKRNNIRNKHNTETAQVKRFGDKVREARQV